LSPLSAAADSGEMNCLAALVMITRTLAPRSRKRRMSSSDLYADTPPPMMSSNRTAESGIADKLFTSGAK
jgi:hypothetical protein